MTLSNSLLPPSFDSVQFLCLIPDWHPQMSSHLGDIYTAFFTHNSRQKRLLAITNSRFSVLGGL